MTDELTRAGGGEEDGVRVRRALDYAVGEAGRRGGAEELVPATRARALRDGRSVAALQHEPYVLSLEPRGEPSVEVGRVGSVGQRKRLVLGKEALGRERP